MSNKTIMDEACQRAWAKRLRVDEMCPRLLKANAEQKELKRISKEKHVQKMQEARLLKRLRADRNLV